MKQSILLSVVLAAGLCSGCTQDTRPPAPVAPADSMAHPPVVHADYDVSSLPVSDLFRITRTQVLQADSLREISGLAASSEEANRTFWAEEDSGNKNAIYLLDTLGKLVNLKYLAGVVNLDWEDMAAGPGPVQGGYYLYVGDIGDNLEIRPFITIYRLEEPGLSAAKDTLVSDFDLINLGYPDGPHNAEAMLVDPATKDIYIFTKDTVAGVYVARYPQNSKAITKLALLETLPISTVTAADVNRDGSKILVKNYDDIYYWERHAGETLTDCLRRPPLRLNYHRELQGESIAWSRDGKSFYTLGEQVGKHRPVLYHYEFF